MASRAHAAASRWHTDLVVVVAAHDEYDISALPVWLRGDENVTFHVYQRHDPRAPNYSPNIGTSWDRTRRHGHRQRRRGSCCWPCWSWRVGGPRGCNAIANAGWPRPALDVREVRWVLGGEQASTLLGANGLFSVMCGGRFVWPKKIHIYGRSSEFTVSRPI